MACCAFANSSGGFLVFGVKDASAGPTEQRLVGLPVGLDFTEQFGNYPNACEPSVQWTFKNPPIQLASGNVVHVVYVPRSWNAPHSLELERGGRRFPKRTQKAPRR
ncbi:MAG: helix-turn-helix domain-containing protein [Ktedonobacterales bacterium]